MPAQTLRQNETDVIVGIIPLDVRGRLVTQFREERNFALDRDRRTEEQRRSTTGVETAAARPGRRSHVRYGGRDVTSAREE